MHCWWTQRLRWWWFERLARLCGWNAPWSQAQDQTHLCCTPDLFLWGRQACLTLKGQTPVEIFGSAGHHTFGPIQGKSERHVRTKTFDGQFSSDLNQSLLCSKLLRWLGWSRAFSAVGIHDPTPCHSFLESWWIAANHNNPNTYISSGKDSKWKSVQRYARQNWKRFTFGRPSHPPLQSELFVL